MAKDKEFFDEVSEFRGEIAAVAVATAPATNTSSICWIVIVVVVIVFQFSVHLNCPINLLNLICVMFSVKDLWTENGSIF